MIKVAIIHVYIWSRCRVYVQDIDDEIKIYVLNDR